jgi:hypothetical protein
MAVMTDRLNAIKHAAKARELVGCEPFRFITVKLKGEAARAVYRVGQSTIVSLILHRDKLAVLEIVCGDRKWSAMQKGCGICISSRFRQGVRR